MLAPSAVLVPKQISHTTQSWKVAPPPAPIPADVKAIPRIWKRRSELQTETQFLSAFDQRMLQEVGVDRSAKATNDAPKAPRARRRTEPRDSLLTSLHVSCILITLRVYVVDHYYSVLDY